MPAPTSATQITFPNWTDLQDTWREIDAEWIRNRSVNIFTDAPTRTSLLSSPPMQGMLSYLQTPPAGHPGGPDFFNPSSAWESVRYPNLNVVSDATSVTLRRQGAGSGIQLLNDGSVNTVRNVVGTGGIGYVGDQTGIALHIGAKTVKLATDANGLTIDSPVSIAGALALTGLNITGNATVSGTLGVTGTTTLGVLNAASLNVTGAATLQGGATVTGTATATTLQAGTTQVTGNQIKANAGTAAITLGTDSTLTLTGSTVTVNPAANFVARPQLAFPSTTPVWIAGIIAVAGNVTPTQNAPDGTLYVTY